jgi:hypothetical protein|tara:strand:+ start:60 stop:170 length:111 start_codon:yes stop_codon:yes gene_type:complete
VEEVAEAAVLVLLLTYRIDLDMPELTDRLLVALVVV